MLNNARDHSGSESIAILMRKTPVNTEMAIIDDGVGIFRKIQREMNLLDDRPRDFFELAKGKLTTDPGRHTGEGIFFLHPGCSIRSRFCLGECIFLINMTMKKIGFSKEGKPASVRLYG